MKRTNLLKTIVCAVMIILVTGTTVMAGTVTRSQNVCGIGSYSNTYTGTYGKYSAAGTVSDATLTLQNTSGASRYYEWGVRRYNNALAKYDNSENGAKALSNGVAVTAEIARNYTASTYNYVHYAKGYASSVYSAATLIDNYTFTAKQHY